MPRPRNPIPAYKPSEPSGQARVRVGGRDVSLGKFGSPESPAESGRVCAEARAPARGVGAPDVSVNEVLVAFLDHAERHYRRADGSPPTS